MSKSPYELARRLATRRAAGDTKPMTYREAQALRTVGDRCEVARRLGFDVKLSKYMESLMRLEGTK